MYNFRGRTYLRSDTTFLISLTEMIVLIREILDRVKIGGVINFVSTDFAVGRAYLPNKEYFSNQGLSSQVQ